MFRQWLFSLLLCIPLLGYAQRRTHLGLNLAPLAVGTLDARLESQLTRKVSLGMTIGGRMQGRKAGDSPSLGFLGDYINLKNRAFFLGVGAKFIHQDPLDYEYPFLAVDLTGMYLHDTYQVQDALGNVVEATAKGFRWGASLTMGFVLRVSDDIWVDLAGQIGYSPNRPELIAYYLPNVGYSTFGYSYVGGRSFHVQPIITVRYNIIKDKRQRIRAVK